MFVSDKFKIMIELTRAEEQVMRYLWRLKKAYVKEIVVEFSEPKPAYNTISTIIRILEKKGVVAHEAFGKTYRYYPILSEKEYTKNFIKRFTKSYFGSSVNKLVSFFANENSLSVKDMEELKQLLDSEIQKKKLLGN